MDRQTLATYDSAAAAFAQDWHDQPAPVDLQRIVLRHFTPGPTADIGCGSGREVAWLNANGFATLGYDASEGLLAEARKRYPDCRFEVAALPDLDGVASGSFDNVLCETVIMHLPLVAIAASVRRLLDLLKPGGTLYLSWRVTTDADQRDGQARLYSAFPASLVRDALDPVETLLDEETISASSGKTIHRIVARKPEGRSR